MIVFSIFSKINGIQINHGLIVENRTFLLWVFFFFFFFERANWVGPKTELRPKADPNIWSVPDPIIHSTTQNPSGRIKWVGLGGSMLNPTYNVLNFLFWREGRKGGVGLFCAYSFFLFFPSKRLESDNYFFFIINYCHLRLDNLGQF